MTDLLPDITADGDDLPDVGVAADEHTVNIPTCPTAVNLYVKLVKEWIPTVTDLDDLCEARRQAEVIRLSVFKMMERDVEFGPAEICRRLERHTGVLIRRGQDAGTIRLQGEHSATEDGGISPGVYLGDSHQRADIYIMAAVTDEVFDQALSAALGDRNLSRRNVARRVKALCPELGATPERPNPKPKLRANPLLYRTRRIDPNRVVWETAIALEGLVMGLALIDGASIDTELATESANSINTSLRALSRFAKEINKEKNNG